MKLRLTQGVLKNAHPRLRLKRQLLSPETKMEAAEKNVEYDLFGS
jgi:hypothetical protein